GRPGVRLLTARKPARPLDAARLVSTSLPPRDLGRHPLGQRDGRALRTSSVAASGPIQIAEPWPRARAGGLVLWPASAGAPLAPLGEPGGERSNGRGREPGAPARGGLELPQPEPGARAARAADRRGPHHHLARTAGDFGAHP